MIVGTGTSTTTVSVSPSVTVVVLVSTLCVPVIVFGSEWNLYYDETSSGKTRNSNRLSICTSPRNSDECERCEPAIEPEQTRILK